MFMPSDGLSSASPLQGDPAQDRRARLHEFRMAALERMTQRGLTLLDDVSAEADPGLTYSRISRAVRQCLMLHARFEEEDNKSAEQKQAEAAAARAAEARRAAQAEAGRKAHQKRQVGRAVTLAMDVTCEAAGETIDYAELYVDLHERLDDYDEYSDFGRLPVGAVVENICRVMGLEFDPALWEDEPWAAAEMAEKPEGSPYADWEPTPPETANDDADFDRDPEDTGDDEADPYGIAEEDEDRPSRRSRGPP
jgi:hypothetical protein